MKQITFNEFCHQYCDGLYDPRFGPEYQCSGYNQLKQLLIDGLTPASKVEMTRWETNPTKEELFSKPDVKYLRSVHPILREFIVKNWDIIKTLPL